MSTNTYLYHIGFLQSYLCNICQAEPKFIDHIFSHCSATIALWRQLQLLSHIVSLIGSTPTPSSTWFRRLLQWHHQPPHVSALPRQIFNAFLLWYLWLTQNKITFEKSKLRQCLHTIRTLSCEFYLALQHPILSTTSPINSMFRILPQPDTIFLYVNAAAPAWSFDLAGHPQD